MKIAKILIIVELDNGNAHQVITTPEQKRLALNMCINEKLTLSLSEKLEPVILKFDPN